MMTRSPSVAAYALHAIWVEITLHFTVNMILAHYINIVYLKCLDPLADDVLLPGVHAPRPLVVAWRACWLCFIQ